MTLKIYHDVTFVFGKQQPTTQEIVNGTIEHCAQWIEDNYPSAKSMAKSMREALKDQK